ncbi:Uncharacterised protein [Clostridioides difficile]|nr:Uncharacterised protein [Clostridioides difficile]
MFIADMVSSIFKLGNLFSILVDKNLEVPIPAGHATTIFILVFIIRFFSMADAKCIAIYPISDSGIEFIFSLSFIILEIFSTPS